MRLRGSILPSFVGRGFLAMARHRVARWDRALERLEQTQHAELRAICGHAARTEFGRAHGLGSVKTHRDFVRQVPLGDYDAFSGAIERMRRGEKNVLVPEFIDYFGNSSGSSNQGKPKFLPIGARQIKFQSGSGLDGLLRHIAFRGDADFTSGFTLGLFPPITMKKEGPVFITNNPALMAVKKPRVSQLVYLPRHEDCLVATDYDKKLELVADRYLDYDVRAIAGTTCWFSLLFDKLIMVAARRGRRADCVNDIWPNLHVLLGGGVSAAPYQDVLRRRMGTADFSLVDTYNATEGGVYAATDHSGEPGLLMIPDRGVFFEFIPAEEHDSASARRVPLWDVEQDKVYAIVVTTPSGLYAYKLGDLVRFTSLRPLRIEFVGRTSGCLSTTQELTTHGEIERAMAAAIAEHPGVAVDFSAAADVGVDGTACSRYVLFVEWSPGAAPRDPGGFIRAFDRGLCQANRVYREHRTGDVAILAPELVILPEGAVKRFLTEVRGGNVQAKFPRIVDGDYQRVLRGYAAKGVASGVSRSELPQ